MTLKTVALKDLHIALTPARLNSLSIFQTTGDPVKACEGLMDADDDHADAVGEDRLDSPYGVSMDEDEPKDHAFNDTPTCGAFA